MPTSSVSSKAKVKSVKPRAGMSRIPPFRPVQLATLVEEVPSGTGWLHEMKWDGYRCLIAVGGRKAKAYTRSGLDWSEKFSQVITVAQMLRVRSALIDGEVVVLDAKGKSDFHALQAGLKDGRAALTFYAFDLLELNGDDLSSLPQIDRKTRLEKLIGSKRRTLRYSSHVIGNGAKLLSTFCDAGLEGVVSKRVDARYVGARTDAWVKTKCTRRQEFVIVGWTPSDKARGFRSLLLGVHDATGLRYVGKVGTGFGGNEMNRLLVRMKPFERKDAPVEAPRSSSKGAHWLEPRLVAEIAFTEETSDGVLRHPSFLGLREDKKAEAVVVEKAAPLEKVNSIPNQNDLITISNPDRVLFPESGITKGQLAEYYSMVADFMLPWSAGRPISLIRCPQGRTKKCFFQKHDAGSFGESVKHVAIREKDGSRQSYLFVENVEGILTCVQMGTIEFHGWGSRIEDVEKADRLVFDLDPDEGLGFEAVRKAAFELRGLLSKFGLSTFPMVTGGMGVHVIAPLIPKAEWPAVKDFALRFSQAVAAKHSDRFTAELSKAKRKGRVFIDYLRNQRGATAVVPYGVHARPGAPVAVPISWDELRSLDRPDHWHVGDARTLVRRAGSKALSTWGRADQILPGA